MGESQQVAEVRRSGCVALPGPLTSENFRRLIAARDCEARSPPARSPEMAGKYGEHAEENHNYYPPENSHRPWHFSGLEDWKIR